MGLVQVTVGHLGHQFMISLFRASVDHARASAYLLAGNPVDLVSSALVLHRAHVEQLLRGVFFGLDATAAELSYFHKHDELPRRVNAQGKMAMLTVADLAAITQTHMEVDHGGQFIAMYQNVKGALNGMVHGGHSLLGAYGVSDTIGCSIEPRVIYEFTANSVAMSHFTLAMLVAEADNQDPQAIHDLLELPHLAFEHFKEALSSAAQRMRKNTSGKESICRSQCAMERIICSKASSGDIVPTLPTVRCAAVRPEARTSAISRALRSAPAASDRPPGLPSPSMTRLEAYTDAAVSAASKRGDAASRDEAMHPYRKPRRSMIMAGTRSLNFRV